MARSRLLCGFLILIALEANAFGAAAQTATPTPRFPNARDLPLPTWTAPVFVLSQGYPTAPPPTTSFPWKQFDFATQPLPYIQSVLRYAYEGNITVDWQVERNTVRKWYHAPWMHYGDSGREFVHGLTLERPSAPRVLATTQASTVQNWAVSAYNAPGGYIIGQVWKNADAPDVSKAKFPDGTIAVKLLFTTATVAQVPILAGSPTWQAHIGTGATRSIRTMRLLQIDLAIRDSRNDARTGWVMGTFIYNKDAPGARSWDKVTPIGVMWGNDPVALANGGPLSESFINPAARPLVTHLGFQGRLNGPVDNPNSSCLSCHGTAEIEFHTMVPNTRSATSLRRFFRNVKAQEAFTQGEVSADYSLQLTKGIENFFIENPPPGAAIAPRAPNEDPVPRGGIVDPIPDDTPTPTPDSQPIPPQPPTTPSSRGLLIAVVAVILLVVVIASARSRARKPAG